MGLVPVNLSNVSGALEVNSQVDTRAPHLVEGVRGGASGRRRLFLLRPRSELELTR